MDSFKILEKSELACVASPIRQRLLSALREPRSASSIARELDVSRQRVGYHMRDLEKAGCIELVREEPARGLTERLYRARPIAYASAPTQAAQQLNAKDRYSWRALVNLVAGALWDLVTLRRRADAAGKRLATLAIDAELHFRNPAERKAFAADLVDAVETVVRQHEQAPSDDTRAFRLVLGAYPRNEGGSSDDEQTDTQH